MLRPHGLLRSPRAAAALTATLAALAAGCASGAAPTDESALLERLESRHEAAMRDFEVARARLDAEVDPPVALPFDRKGTLLLHDLELLGGPGRAYLEARFTYVNTTGEGVPVPTVHLVLLDGAGRDVGGSSMELLRPLGNRFAPDNAFTGTIDADVGDLYLEQGWGWSLDLEVPRTEPEVPPLSRR